MGRMSNEEKRNLFENEMLNLMNAFEKKNFERVNNILENTKYSDQEIQLAIDDNRSNDLIAAACYRMSNHDVTTHYVSEKDHENMSKIVEKLFKNDYFKAGFEADKNHAIERISDLDIIKELVKHGACIDEKTDTTRGIFYNSNLDIDSLKYLMSIGLKLGADKNTHDLIESIVYSKTDFDSLKFIFENGAKINPSYNNADIEIAALYGRYKNLEVMDFLLKHGLDVNAILKLSNDRPYGLLSDCMDIDAENPSILPLDTVSLSGDANKNMTLSYLVVHGFDLGNSVGSDLLKHAIREDNVDAVKFLLFHGVDPILNQRYQTDPYPTLMSAIDCFCSEEITKILLNRYKSIDSSTLFDCEYQAFKTDNKVMVKEIHKKIEDLENKQLFNLDSPQVEIGAAVYEKPKEKKVETLKTQKSDFHSESMLNHVKALGNRSDKDVTKDAPKKEKEILA